MKDDTGKMEDERKGKGKRIRVRRGGRSRGPSSGVDAIVGHRRGGRNRDRRNRDRAGNYRNLKAVNK